jgi:hypothetical protein
VQHPKGGFARFDDSGTGMEGVDPRLPTRIRYTPQAWDGSSGSPVLNEYFELVALHNAGGPEFRRGIPIGLIRQDLEAKGLASLLHAPPTPTDTERVKSLLEAASQRASGDETLRDLLRGSRAILEDVRQRIERIEIYKDLHEFLHRFQSAGLPTLLIQARQQGAYSAETIAAQAGALADAIADGPMQWVALLPDRPLHGREEQRAWLGRMHATARALEQAPDADPVMPILQLRKITRERMAPLNDALRSDVAAIDFNQIVALIEKAEPILAEQAGAAQALMRLGDDLTAQLRLHSQWQMTENDQFALEDIVIRSADLGQVLDDFAMHWRLSWDDLADLCRTDSSNALLTGILEKGGTIREVIDNRKVDMLKRSYLDLRRSGIRAFSTVDSDLRNRAKTMATFTSPLQTLIMRLGQ